MSPTMQDSKFEVIMSSESDLEEGEIPEFDYVTPKTPCEDGEIPDDGYELKHSKLSGTKFKMKHRKDFLDNHFIRQGKLSEDNKKFKEYKTDYSATYGSSSSDRDFIPQPKKSIKSNQKHSSLGLQDTVEKKMKQKHGLKGSYGTVEDIMSQIDQTLCRRRSDYERKKLKDKYNSDKSHRTRSPLKESKPKNKHYKVRRSSSSDSDSENFPSKSKKLTKLVVCKRKREKEFKKSKEIIYLYSDNSISDNEVNEAPRKRNCTEKERRDFDEYRKQLLEKLSKEKSESKLQCENIPLPDDDELSNSSDIQEIEMIDDTNTFIDDKVVKENSETLKNTNNSTETPGKSFMDTYYITRDVSQPTSQPEGSENEDDDTELIKLRLLALTSNRKKKDTQVSDDASSHSLDLEQSSNIDAKLEENSSDLKEENDADLDRNELLLRAEALKTALLKKHKKRLKKTNTDNVNDPSNEKDSEKSNFENPKVNHFNFLKVGDEELNVGQELSLKIEAQIPQISNSFLKNNLDDKVEECNQVSTVLVVKNSTGSDVGLKVRNDGDVIDKLKEFSSLEIARRKLPATLEKTKEVSSFEIARRKLPKNVDKVEENSSLEIARMKLLKVRNALNQNSMSRTIFPDQEHPPKDSLQARLLALANETSLPRLLVQPDACESDQLQQDVPQNTKILTPPRNVIGELTKNVGNKEVLKTLVGKREKPSKKLKRLRWREKRKIKRKEAFLNQVTTSKENSTNSTKLEDDDEKLRVQLLNDLDKRKILNDNNKDSGLIDKLQLPNNRPNETIENKSLLDKQHLESKTNKITINNKAAALPKVPKTEIQRIIIHLGPDSSDDDDLEPQDKSQNSITDQSENRVKEKVPGAIEGIVSKVPLPIDIEKSVELLLQRARQEAEKKQEKNQKAINATPEAVYKHLPPSQRLEYIRLKQKIAEKENLKKKSVTTDNTSSQMKVSLSNNSNNQNLSGIKRIVAASIRSIKNETKASPVSSNNELSAFNKNFPSDSVINEKDVILENSKNYLSPVKCDKTVLDHIDDKEKVVESLTAVRNKLTTNLVIKSPVKAVTVQKITSPPGTKKVISFPANGKKPIVSEEQKKLITQNQAKISKLKLLLKNIKIEKTIEERYEKEIQKLKSQLNLLELKRKQQRLKIERLAKESKLIYAAFQSNREEKKNLTAMQQIFTKGNEKTEDKEILLKNSELIENKKDSVDIKDAIRESSEKMPTADNFCEVEVKVKSDPKENSDVIVETEKSQELEVQFNDCKKIYKHSESVDVSSTLALKEYNSPLQAFTARTEESDSKRIDPNTIMCQYDLLGKCNDEECTFQHYRTS